jgi:uncharacterized protein
MYLTFSGILINPANVDPKDINLIDIAHHLTNECRYGRALPFDIHYSVAEHSLLLAKYMLDTYKDKELAKCALMHDASEYILGDIPTGLKVSLPDYKKLESDLTFKIYEKYDISVKHDLFVSICDKAILINEVLALTPHNIKKFTYNGDIRARLDIKHLAVNDGNYGIYKPGKVPKQVVYQCFLDMCELLGIRD